MPRSLLVALETLDIAVQDRKLRSVSTLAPLSTTCKTRILSEAQRTPKQRNPAPTYLP
jgi:hypothetical protein